MIAGGTEIDEHGADGGQQAVVQPARSSRATRTSASPTAWASRPRRWRSSGRSAARRRTRSRSQSHQKAHRGACRPASSRDEITPIEVVERLPEPRDRRGRRRRRAPSTSTKAPRPDTIARRPGQAASRCSPPRAASPPATARRPRDGAGALILASEKAVKQFDLKPLARFVSFAGARRAAARSWASARSRRFPRRCKLRRPEARRHRTGSSSTRRSPRSRWP